MKVVAPGFVWGGKMGSAAHLHLISVYAPMKYSDEDKLYDDPRNIIKGNVLAIKSFN